MLGITKQKHCAKLTCGFTIIGKLVMVLKSFWNIFVTKDSTNDIKPISAPKIWKLVSGVKKHGRNNLNGYNPCGNHTTHYACRMENPNVVNFAYDHKKQVPHLK